MGEEIETQKISTPVKDLLQVTSVVGIYMHVHTTPDWIQFPPCHHMKRQAIAKLMHTVEVQSSPRDWVHPVKWKLKEWSHVLHRQTMHNKSINVNFQLQQFWKIEGKRFISSLWFDDLDLSLQLFLRSIQPT